MNDIPIFMIAHFNIVDATAYRKYEKRFFPILKRHRGEFLTYDDSPTTLEGAEPMDGRVVLLRFPSEEAAMGWYADPEYKEISQFRLEGTRAKFFSIIHGLAPRKQ